MLARLRKSAEDKDQGFTLIELLVVMIIIGILAAIAIPVFLNQRKKAVDSSMKSDLRSVANEEETYFTDNQAYIGAAAATGTLAIGATGSAKLSTGNSLSVILNTAGTAYCVAGTNPNASHAWVYVSNNGGLQAATVVLCPAPAAF